MTTETYAHSWTWIDQEERHLFGDPDKPYAVDVYRCSRCGAEVAAKGSREPAPGRCKGGGHEYI